MVWLGILTGLYYLLVVVSNVVAAIVPFILDRGISRSIGESQWIAHQSAGLRSFNPHVLAWIQAEAIAAISLHAAIVRGLPVRWVIIWRCTDRSDSCSRRCSTYHHYGTEHMSRGAKLVSLPIDAVWLNHNWHRAHHEHPAHAVDPSAAAGASGYANAATIPAAGVPENVAQDTADQAARQQVCGAASNSGATMAELWRRTAACWRLKASPPPSALLFASRPS